MVDKIKQMEDVYIETEKEIFKKAGAKISHETELVMRSAYSTAAVVFRALGRHEGDESRKKKIIDALGLVDEEPAG